jgi:hypothetical protein
MESSFLKALHNFVTARSQLPRCTFMHLQLLTFLLFLFPLVMHAQHKKMFSEKKKHLAENLSFAQSIIDEPAAVRVLFRTRTFMAQR